MSDLAHDIKEARKRDAADPLRSFREKFHFPDGGADSGNSGNADSTEPWLYFCGNSLGLQPKATKAAIDLELEAWARLGVKGHFNAANPWYSYHEPLLEPMARVVGAKPKEVALMNGLTTNLHLAMVSFYRPTDARFKIVIEQGAFPSDRYAVSSQARFHGYDPAAAIVELRPREGEDTLRTEDVVAYLQEEGDEVALVLLGGVNYLTGQAFQMGQIADAAHEAGSFCGFDLAHGAGNLLLQLHDWDVDFAAWCTYKYLNSGPGGVAGLFVHEKHGNQPDIPRFEGWWGTDPKTRFEMRPHFDPQPGAGAWTHSNVPVLTMAALRASLDIFDEATMPALRQKSVALTGWTESLVKSIPGIEVITPEDPEQRGCQLSIRTPADARTLHGDLYDAGIVCDFRVPDVIRIAPVPLYNSYEDTWRFADTLRKLLSA